VEIKNNTLTEEIDRIKTIIGFDFNYNTITEAEEKLEVFEFGESYPDNIAYPVIAGATIKNWINNLTPDLNSFINRLKSKIKTGTKIDKIKIKSGASTKNANTEVPTGYNKPLVQYSYYDPNGVDTDVNGKIIKVKIDNAVLAKRRGIIMRNILKNKLGLTDDNFELSASGNKKSVIIGVPTTTLINFSKLKDYVKPKQIYDPKTEPNIKVTKCNSNINATGSAGKSPLYIADKIKLDFQGDGPVTFNYNSYVVPDRFVIRGTKDGKTYSTIKDTGFVTSLTNNDPMFKGLESELKLLFPKATLIGGKGSGTIKFNKSPGHSYIISVIAPFGGTQWGASLKCGEMKTTQTKPQGEELKDKNGKKIVDAYHKAYNDKGDISHDGEFKNGNLWSGKKYIYDDQELLRHIEIWKDGKNTGEKATI